MAVCTYSALFKAYTPRLLLSVFFCAATVVFASACYVLLLSSASMPNLAAFLPQISAASIIYRNCPQISRAGGVDRGSELFHSWSDAELFNRTLSAEAKSLSEGNKEGGGNGGIVGLSVLGLRKTLFNSMPRGRSKDDLQQSSIIAGYGGTDEGNSSSKLGKEEPACFRRRRRYRLGRAKPKLAFLFLTRGPLPFAQLWKKFFNGYGDLYNIYVHLDPFRVGVLGRESAGVFWGRFVPPDLTRRGAPSLVAAERRLLANALLDDPLNHYFALVSERCIPLVSFTKLYNHVVASDKSFLEILKNEPTMHGRYDARGAATVMLPEVPFERFRVGSQFFVLTREHAVMVIADETIWRKFRIPCKHESNCYTEEHYFPTLIDMVDATCTTRRTLTNVDWSKSNGDGHPRTYHRNEVRPELITALRRNGTFMFARKFEDECLEPLLQLSSFILGGDGTPNPE